MKNLKVKRTVKTLSYGEEMLNLHFIAKKLTPEREFRFHPKRLWRFDFAFPEKKIAIEIEGGLSVKTADGKNIGRHTRKEGYEKDLEKYNEATLLGWKVLRYSTSMVRKGVAINDILRLLDNSEKV